MFLNLCQDFQGALRLAGVCCKKGPIPISVLVGLFYSHHFGPPEGNGPIRYPLYGEKRNNGLAHVSSPEIFLITDITFYHSTILKKKL